ncbi:hypothetical protein BGX23_011146 [Mortierella sp. AD031]|nr:hypothetical protein BGX23_011146 [Mortierella sp. AD031]
MTPECKKALRRNKDYIRTIWYRAQRSDIVRLILSVPDLRLTELHIATREFKGKGLESVLGILEKFLRVLQMNTCPKEMEKCFLETCSSELEGLTAELELFTERTHLDTANAMAGPVPGSKRHPKLRHLRLWTNCRTKTDEAIAPAITEVLDALTGIKSHYFDRSRVTTSHLDDVVAQGLTRICTGTSDGDQGVWTTINLGGCSVSTPKTVNLIIVACVRGC